MTTRRTGWRAGALAISLLALTSAVLAAPASSAPTDGAAAYVALGDSGAATTGVQKFDTGAPLQCARSTANTPKLVAADLGLKLDDRTCSSAKISDLTASQGPGIPPQFDALGPKTQLVTVHIGANDAKMTKYILTCHLAGAKPCADPAWDTDIDSIAAAYSTALHRISSLAPNAAIFVDGWPTYVRDGGCPDLIGLRPPTPPPSRPPSTASTASSPAKPPPRVRPISTPARNPSGTTCARPLESAGSTPSSPPKPWSPTTPPSKACAASPTSSPRPSGHRELRAESIRTRRIDTKLLGAVRLSPPRPRSE
ncbi:SGNH/GDSL hydrolase family protein [Nocardia pseudovaccinii]|uniref:SGNH/GDSL hydrolase family protein n=1 Tax=Nocardia pseudovaccinii TaxID=189540 RepID=UPI000A400873|nr:SGNH/GDSL hydrolase family protein [Nocardia pseudovaccinii]